MAKAKTMTILKCSCEHKFQDSRYGKGNRLHTIGTKSNSCTVCGTKR